jgi:hypothetical protein
MVKLCNTCLKAPERISATKLAGKYGVSEKAIRDIWQGRTWDRETWHLDTTRPRIEKQRGRPRGSKDRKPRKSKNSNNTQEHNGSILDSVNRPDIDEIWKHTVPDILQTLPSQGTWTALGCAIIPLSEPLNHRHPAESFQAAARLPAELETASSCSPQAGQDGVQAVEARHAHSNTKSTSVSIDDLLFAWTQDPSPSPPSFYPCNPFEADWPFFSSGGGNHDDAFAASPIGWRAL